MKNSIFFNRRLFLKILFLFFFNKTVFSKAKSISNKIIIAFGSCSNQNREMRHWKTISDERPDYLFLLGDNVYGDFLDESASELIIAYNILKNNFFFQKLIKNTKIVPTWDDHDYGINDGGKNWKYKNVSKLLFLDFFEVKNDDIRRTREGIYRSWKINSSKIIKIIALDTRTFKDDFTLNYKKNSKKKYIKNFDKEKTILGNSQWNWLDKEIHDKYDILIILSSIQVISKSHGWEKWDNFPHERNRLLNALSNVKKKVILLSGDRHVGGFYKVKINKKVIYEFTSSSLNQRVFSFNENDELRVGSLVQNNNFGHIEFNLDLSKLIISLKSTVDKNLIFFKKTIFF